MKIYQKALSLKALFKSTNRTLNLEAFYKPTNRMNHFRMFVIFLLQNLFLCNPRLGRRLFMDLYILCSELVFTVSNGEMSGGRTVLMSCVSVYLYGCLIRGVCRCMCGNINIHV